jgi:alkylation response protein AidB-like acyl-CoA dehydrogenase
MTPTTNDRGPYRMLVGNGNWPIATSVAAVQLGNARRALDEGHRLALGKAPMPDFVRLADNAAVQRQLVEAEGACAAAVASVERELETMWSVAREREELPAETRTRLHRANLNANRVAVGIVDSVCEFTGTESVGYANVLSRTHRDAHALRAHISVRASAVEHNAKVSLGIEGAHILV